MIDKSVTAVRVEAILLKSSARAPEIARKWVAGVFRQWCLGDDYVGRTVITELVTNVFKHTETELISVRLLLEDGQPVVEVEDRSDDIPVVRDMDGDMDGEDGMAESGRGLPMLSMLVREWGVRTLEQGGKVTWARLGE